MHRPLPLRSSFGALAAAFTCAAAAPALAAGDDPRAAEPRRDDGPVISVPGPTGPSARRLGKLYFTQAIPEDRVTVVDLDTKKVSDIVLPEGTSAWWLDATSDASRLFVTDLDDGWVYGVDLATKAVVDKAYWGTADAGAPGFVTVNPGDQSITLTRVDVPHADTLAADDLGDVLASEVVPNLEVLGPPAWRPGTLDLYFPDWGTSQSVTMRRPVVDWNTGELVSTWSTFDIPHTDNLSGLDSTVGVDFLPAMGLVGVTNGRGYELAIVDEATHVTLARSWVAAHPGVPTVAPGSTATRGRVFVPSYDAGQLMVFVVERRPSGEVRLTIEEEIFDICSGPTRVVFADNVSNVAYVACNWEIIVLDTNTLEPIDSIETKTWQTWEMIWAAK